MERPAWTQTVNGYLGVATRDTAGLIALSDEELSGLSGEDGVLAANKMRLILQEIQDVIIAASALL